MAIRNLSSSSVKILEACETTSKVKSKNHQQNKINKRDYECFPKHMRLTFDTD